MKESKQESKKKWLMIIGIIFFAIILIVVILLIVYFLLKDLSSQPPKFPGGFPLGTFTLSQNGLYLTNNQNLGLTLESANNSNTQNWYYSNGLIRSGFDNQILASDTSTFFLITQTIDWYLKNGALSSSTDNGVCLASNGSSIISNCTNTGGPWIANPVSSSS